MSMPLIKVDVNAAWGAGTQVRPHEFHRGMIRWGFRTALAATLFLIVALIPAVATQPRVVRNNGPWHTVRASQICEPGGELNPDVRLGKESALPRGVFGEEIRYTAAEFPVRELDGMLPLPPLRSPPQS